MTRLFLIRHGEPEAAWGVADDPGLSAAGRTQAEAAAGALTPDLASLSSPMRRCQETAAPFEARLGARARIEPRVSEVATPGDIPDRRAWLGETFPWRDGAPGRDWATLDAGLHRWRADALDAVRAITADTAVFTHFIAINAIVGAALGRNETIVCRPNYASITELSVEHGVLRLVALGAAMSEGDVR
jgi:broad specificity phosphatase PhoE